MALLQQSGLGGEQREECEGRNPCPDLGTKAEGEGDATMSAVPCRVGRGWVAVMMVALAAAAARQ